MKNKGLYQKYLFTGILLVLVGLVCTMALKDPLEPIGNILVAIGGLLVVFGLSKKKRSEKKGD